MSKHPEERLCFEKRKTETSRKGNEELCSAWKCPWHLEKSSLMSPEEEKQQQKSFLDVGNTEKFAGVRRWGFICSPAAEDVLDVWHWDQVYEVCAAAQRAEKKPNAAVSSSPSPSPRSVSGCLSRRVSVTCEEIQRSQSQKMIRCQWSVWMLETQTSRGSSEFSYSPQTASGSFSFLFDLQKAQRRLKTRINSKLLT